MTETVFVLPATIDQWNLSVIKKLVELKYPESDSLEFKEKIPKDFENDICAFANSYGGFIVIGIGGKDKAEELKPLTDEHDLIQQATGKLAQIEPVPVTKSRTISDETGHYLILKIDGESYHKPYFVKNRGSFHVRLNGSTHPASRAIILNWFTESIGRRQRLIVLKYAIEVLIRDLQLRKNTGSFSITKDYVYNIVEINTDRLKDAIVNAGDLIFGLDGIGNVDKSSTSGGLLTTALPEIDIMNANIKAFNNSKINSQERANSVEPIILFGTSKVIGVIDNLTRFQAAIDKLLGIGES